MLRAELLELARRGRCSAVGLARGRRRRRRTRSGRAAWPQTGQSSGRGFADVAGRPEELGVGVAHVEAGDARRVGGPGGRPDGPARSRCAGARRAVYRRRSGVRTVLGTARNPLPVRRASAERRVRHRRSRAVYSPRYIEPIYRPPSPRSSRTPVLELAILGLAEGAAAPRLRAEEAPRRDARLAVGHLLRLAVSGAPPARARRRHRERRPRHVGQRRRSRHRFARRRPRGGAPAPSGRSRAGARARRTGSPRAATPASRSCSLDRRRRRRRAHLRAEARVLRPPRARRRASSSSSAVAPSSPTASRAPRRSRPRRGDRYTRSLFEHRTAVHTTRPRMGRRAHRRRRARRRLRDRTQSTPPDQRSQPHHEWSHSRRHRRSRELREQPRPGRRVLPERRSRRRGAGPHARRARRLPRR